MRSLIIFLALIFLLSCTNNNKKNSVEITTVDSIKIFNNKVLHKTQPVIADLNQIYKINLDKIGLTDFKPSTLGDNGKLYLYSYNKGKIAIISNKGKLENVFAGNGQGPGEIIQPQDVMIIDDTLFVVSVNSKIVNKYNLEGRFTNSLHPNNVLAMNISKVSNNLFLGMQKKYAFDDKGQHIDFNVAVFDPYFKNIINIGEKLITRWRATDNLLKMAPIFGGNNIKKEIYIATQSDYKYEIIAYDLKGNEKYKIYRNYSKIPLSNKQKNDCFEYFRKEIKNLKVMDIKNKYNLAINKLFVDKYGNLLVCYSSRKHNGDLLVDVYKDGVFQKKLYFPGISNYDIHLFMSSSDVSVDFINDKLVVYKQDTNDLIIYEYNY